MNSLLSGNFDCISKVHIFTRNSHSPLFLCLFRTKTNIHFSKINCMNNSYLQSCSSWTLAKFVSQYAKCKHDERTRTTEFNESKACKKVDEVLWRRSAVDEAVFAKSWLWSEYTLRDNKFSSISKRYCNKMCNKNLFIKLFIMFSIRLVLFSHFFFISLSPFRWSAHKFHSRNMRAYLKRNVLAWLNCRIWAKSACRNWAYHWDLVCVFCKKHKFLYVKTRRCA